MGHRWTAPILSGGLLAFAACGGGPVPEPAPTAATTQVPTPAPNVLTVTQPGGSSARVTVEFATTAQERQRGLMLRESLAPDAGMLFVFASDTTGGFWMKDTLIPLTIAYISADGRVMELRDGVPRDLTSLRPAAPYRYVLEVNKGWFPAHGLGVGAQVELPSGTPPPQ